MNFNEWMKPSEAYATVNKFMPNGADLWKGENKKFLEYWVLSRFAIGYELLIDKKSQIRLHTEEPVDGQLRIDSKIFDFQICERLREGRERHREYKELEKEGRSEFKLYQPASPEQALEWVITAINNKDQRYGIRQPLSLLVYVDFNYQGMELDRITAAVKAKKVKAFTEVWLLGSCWSSVGDGAVIGRAFPDQWGFLPFVPSEERVIAQQELDEPFMGWKHKRA